MQTLHHETDQHRLEELTASIKANGWQGAPLVTLGPYQLLTGTHRYLAARRLNIADDDLPKIDIDDVFDEDGLDFSELHAAYGYPTSTDLALIDLLNELSDDTRLKYGIDIH